MSQPGRQTESRVDRYETGGVMLANKTRVLLILPRDLLDRARVLAGKATATFKLPVSLQIVLRALIGEGLKRDDDPALLANMEGAGQGGPLHAERGAASRGCRGEGGVRRSGIFSSVSIGEGK